ncbi:MAG: aminomethyl-transferring glycine dehydrogenase subunit GcvPA [Pseudomonadota bacterium]
MPFIPHTENDIKTMLAEIGVDSISSLFDEIPNNLLISGLDKTIIPKGKSEHAATLEMQTIAAKDQTGKCFIGAGAYQHYIPAAVWQIASRGEFLTAYTPYQAEASQGSLQLLYEYQTMMASLMSMEIANASLYEGASAVAEAVLMAVRVNRQSKSKLILVPKTLHPFYRQTIKSIVKNQNIHLEEIDFDVTTGRINIASLTAYEDKDVTAMIINQPNFFGVLEDTDNLTNWAQQHKAIAIAVVNPTAMALFKPPGQWGEKGADIVCGEGQPLGVPLASGGPYFGFMCTRKEHVRQLPGRIVARSHDVDGKQAFTLTLQAREQHIRRSKATSNICTNQGLLVTAATIYLSLLGPVGLKQVASLSHSQTKCLKEKLIAKGITNIFNMPFFHEIVLQLPCKVQLVREKMAAQGIQAGFDLTPHYPQLGNALLVCATETKTEADLNDYAEKLALVLQELPADEELNLQPIT